MLDQQEGLQTERRKGRVPSEDTDHQERAGGLGKEQFSWFGFPIARKQPHKQSTRDVDHDGAEGKLATHPAGDEIRYSDARHRSQGTTHGGKHVGMIHENLQKSHCLRVGQRLSQGSSRGIKSIVFFGLRE